MIKRQARMFEGITPAIVPVEIPADKISKLIPVQISQALQNIKLPVYEPLPLFIDLPTQLENYESLVSQSLDRAQLVPINLIKVEGGGEHQGLAQILQAINAYLLKNKSFSSDFGIIKDTIERECEGIDEQINSAIQMPLYWGLMGTMLGIVVGVLGLILPNEAIAGEGFIDTQVQGLLKGVGLAMVASFLGLALTVANLALYKKTLGRLSRGRNDFYNFLQCNLLPTMTKGTQSNIKLLESTLYRFNSDFQKNLASFSQNTMAVQENLALQRDFMRDLSALDFNKIVEGTIRTFRELRDSAAAFDRFKEYQESLNETVNSLKNTILRFDRTERDFKDLVSEFSLLKENSSQIAKTLTAQNETYAQLSKLFEGEETHIANWKDKINKAAVGLDNIMQKSFEALEDHSQDYFQKMKDVVESEFIHLNKVYEDSKDRFKHLDQLVHLRKLDDMLVALRDKGQNNPKEMQQALKESVEQLKSLNEQMEFIHHALTRPKGIFSFFRARQNHEEKD